MPVAGDVEEGNGTLATQSVEVFVETVTRTLATPSVVEDYGEDGS